ncbi:hypothetical protein QBC38DRAFT_477336 [Podospora fimiseda]|uniref:G-patch domain-containing protein n=1 Tax=Podospora fimiseda TaxID=252190 RepID=A0AAN7H2X4_9PEZI|nr:hypothetical protein QBC38DRAFT_477336 [Podospora fimiseda]
MDAHALLKSQGWRGKGHTLHHTSNSIGLTNPLLISRNTDGRGIGTKTHYTSDQWWLDAFDQKLKGLDTSKDGKITQTVVSGKLDVIASGVKQGKYTGAKGLYAFFVRGGTLNGTDEQGEEEESGRSTPVEKDDKKERKRLEKEERKRKKEEEKKRRKEEKKVAKKAAKLLIKAEESKEERKERRKERRKRKEEERRRRELKNGSG